MKLVIATPLYPPEIGGPATYARLLEEGLPAHGIEVEIVKFSDVRYLPKIIRHIAYYRNVLAAAREADIILALDPVSVGLPAMKVAKKLNRKFVVKIVGDYAWEQGRQRFGVTQKLDEFVRTKQSSWFVRRLQVIEKKVADAADAILVPSEYLKRIVSSWGIPDDTVTVIYNAVPIEHIGTVPESVSALLQPRVVTVGRLVPWKGIDRLIEGVWSARRDGSSASLVVVGEGPEATKLKNKAAQLLKDNYVFTGALSHEDTLAVIKSADIFVLNSSYEGLSHTLIEALHLGASILATDVGGNAEVIVKGSGLIIKEGNQELLASNLKLLIEHEDKRKELSEGTKIAAKRFVPETMLYETATFLKTI